MNARDVGMVELEDFTIGDACKPGDLAVRIDLPPWFSIRQAKPPRWDGRRRQWVTKTWRPIWDPLTMNGGKANRWDERAAIDTVKDVVVAKARQLRVPSGERLTVCVTYRPAQHRSRDGMNLAPLSKFCLDALARGPRKTITKTVHGRKVEIPRVGLDLVPDDNDRYVDERRPAILAPDPARPALWLDLIVHSPHAA